MEVWGGNHAATNGVSMSGLDAWILSRPCGDSEAGGDVHYVSSCASGRISRMLLADVSGHGAGVARVGVRLRDLLRRYINHIDQARFVESVNREFGAIEADGLFATSVVATFYAPDRTLAISNAGHPPPLVRSARQRGWTVFAPDDRSRVEGPANLPLGVIEPTQYDTRSLRLARGDLILFYTDALIEERGLDGRALGVEGLCELVNAMDVQPVEDFIPRLLDRAFGARSSLSDDLTILMLQANGTAPQRGLFERLAGMGKFFKQLAHSALPGGPPPPWPEFSRANVLGYFAGRFARRAGRDPKL